MLTKFYRKIVPEKIRKVIYNAFLGRFLSFVRDPNGESKCLWYRIYYSIFSPKNAIPHLKTNHGNFLLIDKPHYLVGKVLKCDLIKNTQ